MLLIATLEQFYKEKAYKTLFAGMASKEGFSISVKNRWIYCLKVTTQRVKPGSVFDMRLDVL